MLAVPTMSLALCEEFLEPTHLQPLYKYEVEYWTFKTELAMFSIMRVGKGIEG